MARKNAPYAALLAAWISVDCMRFHATPRPVQSAKGRLFLYSANGGTATIKKSLSTSDRPQEFLGNAYLLYEEGDAIEGKDIWGCSDRPPGKILVGTSNVRSGGHSRQEVDIKAKELCYAVVISSWDGRSIAPPHPVEIIREPEFTRIGKESAFWDEKNGPVAIRRKSL